MIHLWTFLSARTYRLTSCTISPCLTLLLMRLICSPVGLLHIHFNSSTVYYIVLCRTQNDWILVLWIRGRMQWTKFTFNALSGIFVCVVQSVFLNINKPLPCATCMSWAISHTFLLYIVKSRSPKVILKLYLTLVRPHLDYAVPHYRKDIGLVYLNLRNQNS